LSLVSTGDLTEGEKLEQATLDQSLSHLQAAFDEIQINYNQKKASYGTNWKEIYHSTKQELIDIDSHIADIRHQLLKVQQHIGALAALQTTLSLTKQELLSLKTTVDQLTQRQHTINELLSTPLYQSLDGLLPLLQSCDKGIAKAQDLYHEKKRVEKESLSLKKELDTSTLLHTIFGKELTLYVL
jgi:chromosome segregation ATPase